MTEDFNLQTFRYLLDELEPGERAAFEVELERNPAAQTALRACAEAVAQFAYEAAPAEPLSSSQHQRTLAGIIAAVTVSPPPLETIFSWRRYLWPVAAALLLGLNLVQYFRPADFTLERIVSTEPEASPSPVKKQGIKTSAQKDPSGSVSPKRDGSFNKSKINEADAAITAELHRLEKLRSQYTILEHKREALGAEYDGIIRQLAQRTLPNKGVSRLAAMELVDAASFANGERKGLVDIARGILTEPGIVAVEPVVSQPNGLDPDAVAPTLPTLGSPTTSENTNTFAPTLPKPSTSSEPTLTKPPSDPVTGTPDTGQPYAWSVYDEVANRGYLNLYNLPKPATDQTLQLWVKSPGATTYQGVGEVPSQFYGGAGSLYYTLPGATEPPGEILITREPRTGSAQQPTGPVILRGP